MLELFVLYLYTFKRLCSRIGETEWYYWWSIDAYVVWFILSSTIPSYTIILHHEMDQIMISRQETEILNTNRKHTERRRCLRVLQRIDMLLSCLSKNLQCFELRQTIFSSQRYMHAYNFSQYVCFWTILVKLKNLIIILTRREKGIKYAAEKIIF